MTTVLTTFLQFSMTPDHTRNATLHHWLLIFPCDGCLCTEQSANQCHLDFLKDDENVFLHEIFCQT